jgi:hypothetical protein
MGLRGGAYRVLEGKPEGKSSLARPRRRRDDHIKMCFEEVGLGDLQWIDLAQDKDR